MAKQAHDQGLKKRRIRELGSITSRTSNNSDRRTNRKESK